MIIAVWLLSTLVGFLIVSMWRLRQDNFSIRRSYNQAVLEWGRMFDRYTAEAKLRREHERTLEMLMNEKVGQ